jgi:hypothetical protein
MWGNSTLYLLALFVAQVADAAIIRRGLITRKSGGAKFRATLVAGGITCATSRRSR